MATIFCRTFFRMQRRRCRHCWLHSQFHNWHIINYFYTLKAKYIFFLMVLEVQLFPEATSSAAYRLSVKSFRNNLHWQKNFIQRSQWTFWFWFLIISTLLLYRPRKNISLWWLFLPQFLSFVCIFYYCSFTPEIFSFSTNPVFALDEMWKIDILTFIIHCCIPPWPFIFPHILRSLFFNLNICQ